MNRTSVAAVSIAFIFLSHSLFAQTSPGPWDNDILFTRSQDGTHFDTAQLLVNRAGVSTIVRDTNNRLIAAFQWFPDTPQSSFDKIAVMFSTDNGQTWTSPQTVQFINLPANITRQFDPTLVMMTDGRIRLYFTGNPDSSPTLNASTGIYSAYSTDGLHFTYEAGERFGTDDAPVIDCAVVNWNDSWHLYSPIQEASGSAYHATSSDGLNFTRQADIVASQDVNWLGCAIVDGNSVRFFGTAAPGGTLRGIWTAQSNDGSNWSTPTSIAISGADPGAVYLNDGSIIITTTGKLPASGIQSWKNYRAINLID